MRFKIVVLFFIVFALFAVRAVGHPGSGIVVDKQGNVFFTDTGRGVWKVDIKGNLTYVTAQLWHWLAIDEIGYFKESQKNFGEWFERVSPQSATPVLVMCSDFPVTVNRDGNIYYADTRPGSPRIMRRMRDGKESVLAEGKMFLGISGITSAPDGSLYVTDASRSDATVIRKITMKGIVSIFAGAEIIGRGKTGVANPPPETGPAYCRGLAVDSSRNMYVAATGTRRVLKITPQGETTTLLQEQSPWSPTGVTVFQGEVYTLEWSDAPPSLVDVRKAWVPRVRKIGRDGKVTTIATVSR